MGREAGICKTGAAAMQLDPTGKWILTGRYWKRKSDGYLLPVIQGGGPANTVQNNKYAFGDDDNNEATHTRLRR
jgi:hypothetical protein